MTVIGVYVTSRYANYGEFKAVMDEAVKKYLPTGKPNAFCTGSSKGNTNGNALVRRYAFELGVPCRVFETRWADHIPTKPGKKNDAGVRSNAMIIRNSTGCIMFWTPTSIAKWDYMSGGCYNFRKMCGKMRRELIPIKVDIYKPVEEPPDEEIRTAPNEEQVGDIGMGARASEMPPVGGAASSPAEMPTVDIGGGGSLAAVTAASPPEPPAMPQGDVVDLPVDITGDGVPDTTITALDTNGDGTPDSVVTPVDVDGNGTIDTVEVTPFSDLQPSASPTTQPTPTAAAQPASPASTGATPSTATDDEEKSSPT